MCYTVYLRFRDAVNQSLIWLNAHFLFRFTNSYIECFAVEHEFKWNDLSLDFILRYQTTVEMFLYKKEDITHIARKFSVSRFR